MKPNAWILGLTVLMATPALAAEQNILSHSARLVDLTQAPVSPSQLTDGKKEDAAILILRAAKREKVIGVSGFEALVSREKARDAALMEIIGPDSPVTHAFADALEKKLGVFLSDNVSPDSAKAIALQMVQSIFLNRRDDLTSTQNLYADVAWRKAIMARLQKNDIPELDIKLKDAKREELKNTALFVHTPGNPEGKMEPAVHLILTALAQQVGHAALADITKPGSPVHSLFMESIAKTLPNDPAAKDWLNDWLILRGGRAQAVADDFRPDGELIQGAVAESETKRRARMKSPPPIAYKP